MRGGLVPWAGAEQPGRVCNGGGMEAEVCVGGGIEEGACDGGGMENGKQRKGGGNGDQVRPLKPPLQVGHASRDPQPPQRSANSW